MEGMTAAGNSLPLHRSPAFHVGVNRIAIRSPSSRSTSFIHFSPWRFSENRYHKLKEGCIFRDMDHSSNFCRCCNYWSDTDIASQLPELTNLLQVLRDRRVKEGVPGENTRPGTVFLVGTGPGDPDLLTLKAARVIQSADLVLYDRLVSNDVLSMVGLSARLLYVGKSSGYHSRTQEEIHELLLNFAEVGAKVVRLKGGDPLVFGRGGEEMDFLQRNGIQVNVIPGITAASGIAAELRIPLTQRGVADSVRFLTGHSRKGGLEALNVAADPESTLVFYMGLATLPLLASKLIQHGLFPGTPAVAVERGTTPQQRMVFGELCELGSKVGSAGLMSPTLIIIGKVVALSPLWPCRNTSFTTLEEEEEVHPSI